MSLGHVAADGNAILEDLDGLYVKLHTGDPGAAGTSNAATETTRKQISLGSAASGSISNDTAITWTSIAGSQDATHFTLWTAASGGSFKYSGTITAAAYTAGNTYEVAIGGLTITQSIAA